MDGYGKYGISPIKPMVMDLPSVDGISINGIWLPSGNLT